MNIPTVTIFGVKVSKLGFRETLDLLCRLVEERQPTQVVTVNPIMIMAGLEDPGYMQMLKQAELLVPDGAGVVWASEYVGSPVAEKVAGVELMQELLRVAEERGWRAYFVGASPEVIEAAVDSLRRRFPRLEIAGYRDGYFDDTEDEEVVAAIREARAELLFVGRSAARQEPWIHRYKARLGVPVMMGIGGSFDIVSGKLKRAPKPFIKLRLEWLYRLMQEPSRYKRMLVLPKFAMKVIREKDKVQKP